MKEVICKVCNKSMRYLGNVSGMVYTSYPSQWDDVYICDTDKTKQTIREHGTLPNNPDLKSYKEQS
jgi:hypothetical protein